MPLRSRFRKTEATSGLSEASFASRSTIEARMQASYFVRPEEVVGPPIRRSTLSRVMRSIVESTSSTSVPLEKAYVSGKAIPSREGRGPHSSKKLFEMRLDRDNSRNAADDAMPAFSIS
ncbi:MAG: hypothetical protein BWY66_00322 [bacterium ADurb.Bin374]|nr:MAG: hypothetical protein BWY66_00322 [bacterium ADurb.Bin374]